MGRVSPTRRDCRKQMLWSIGIMEQWIYRNEIYFNLKWN
ncbi:hypothetical protein D1BOALGB6SA_3356 [Olavius sp. associated proteobacterium Delta 1]|nr:hypothetical protein D1BOALGB6SA_3356 [Olavius sp. associated proteobacterium Delta 1]